MPGSERVRLEELYGAFDYGSFVPVRGEEVGCRVEQSAHPFLPGRNLVRIVFESGLATGAEKSLSQGVGSSAGDLGAQDLEVRVRFNPSRVGSYRLLGFAGRRLEKPDARNGEAGAARLAGLGGGAAIYQVEPLAGGKGEIGEVSVRFREYATGAMAERSWTIPYEARVPAFDQASSSMRLAGVAAMLVEKLGGGSGLDLEALSPVVYGLMDDYPEQERVRDLVRIFQQATQ